MTHAGSRVVSFCIILGTLAGPIWVGQWKLVLAMMAAAIMLALLESLLKLASIVAWVLAGIFAVIIAFTIPFPGDRFVEMGLITLVGFIVGILVGSVLQDFWNRRK